MNLRKFLAIMLVSSVLAATYWGMRGDADSGPLETGLAVSAHSSALSGSAALLPLPAVPPLPADKVELGRLLFFDRRLSRDDTIACASCHQLDSGGSDRLLVSVGIDGRKGSINAPTVFNSSLNFVQFWDGRAASLEEQAAGPVHNPLEMGSNWAEVIAKLSRDEDYRQAFGQLYKQGITGETIVDAIATFERTLLTPNAPVDRFLAGDQKALDPLERAGYQRFLDYGCASCHQGAGIGGNMFQRFGVMDDYLKERANRQSDLGRFNVTGLDQDRNVFKVPSLRNVAVTPPYFHDGSAKTLDEAVIVMGRYQLGRELSEDDVKALVAFLRALTGEWEGKRLQ
ncbi:MAG: cytochrome-c peroxidase [Gammaproteobacteria bacterium]|nr:cytochrome-c peroxidase [Gammaproteobacteria bacterium]MBU1601231.1 cytochrome-c peroxidase [Gammaproteobacteria bacterium]MBU2433813.1 cytochrome-c peroxidase [Gammaproteobacteria bacterium]MBU2450670.1 cytochrome-c peroxidase [Gammaproteobacteria bacterium]